MNELTVSNTAFAEIAKVAERREIVAKILKEQMKEGTHFGPPWPGSDKKILYKVGADMIGLVFRFVSSYNMEIFDLQNGHRECRSKCTITCNDIKIGEGGGTCSTMESKYRYRDARRTCPVCGYEIMKSNKPSRDRPNDPPGWFCWKNPDKGKNGCGAEFAHDDPAIIHQEIGKIENPNPHDQHHTVFAMSQKRSKSRGIIEVTGCADLFTSQSGEDPVDAAIRAGEKSRSDNPPPENPPPPQEIVCEFCGGIGGDPDSIGGEDGLCEACGGAGKLTITETEGQLLKKLQGRIDKALGQNDKLHNINTNWSAAHDEGKIGDAVCDYGAALIHRARPVSIENQDIADKIAAADKLGIIPKGKLEEDQ
jgi:hypothetical protein